MSHHVDHFYAAVTVLAGAGHIKQRLIDAYGQHLDSIDVDNLPVTIKQAFSDLKHQMHRVDPLNGEGAICASVRKMSVADASNFAVAVVAIYSELASSEDNSQATLPFDGQDRPETPFLVNSN